MHSRIFAFTTILNSQEKDINKLSEIHIPSDDQLADHLSDYGYHFFDYICQRNERQEDIEWLVGNYESLFTVSTDNLPNGIFALTITKESLKQHYFEKATEIQDYIDEKGICPGDDMWVYRIKNLIETTDGGFYFYNLTGDDFDTCTAIDSFLLEVKRYFDYRKVDSITLYVCETYDYHF